MTQEIVRTQEEIDEILDWCTEAVEEDKTHYFGQSYEDGVQAMYDWLVGNTDDKPNE